MFCTDCGSEITGTGKFCISCGRKLRDPAQDAMHPAPVPLATQRLQVPPSIGGIIANPNAIKAVCYCKKMAEDHQVLAVKPGRLGFLSNWGFFSWVGAAILVIATGGIWIGVIVGWHLFDMLDPPFRCTQCNEKIPPKQFRA